MGAMIGSAFLLASMVSWLAPDPGLAGAAALPAFETVAPVSDTLPEPRDPEIIRTDDFSVRLAARLQLRYTYAIPDEDPSAGAFRVRRGRVALSGSAYEHFDYALQLELAGPSVNLIDANVRVRPVPFMTLWLGQGKAYFGRQQLVSSRDLNFVDRTLVDDRFSMGRQIGAAALFENDEETLEVNVGVYNGTGINAPNPGGSYLSVGRIVWTPFGEYGPVESAHDYPDMPRLALGGSVARNTVGTGPGRVRVTRFNVESAYMVRGFNAMAEVYRERAAPADGASASWTTGWYVQPGFLLPDRRYEIAGRYGAISPSGTDADVTELGVALSRYLSGHRAKIQGDVRRIWREAADATDLELRVQLQLAL